AAERAWAPQRRRLHERPGETDAPRASHRRSAARAGGPRPTVDGAHRAAAHPGVTRGTAAPAGEVPAVRGAGPVSGGRRAPLAERPLTPVGPEGGGAPRGGAGRPGRPP